MTDTPVATLVTGIVVLAIVAWLLRKASGGSTAGDGGGSLWDGGDGED